MSNKERVTLRLPEDTVALLRQLSDQRGISMSKVVRDLLTKYLDRLY